MPELKEEIFTSVLKEETSTFGISNLPHKSNTSIDLRFLPSTTIQSLAGFGNILI